MAGTTFRQVPVSVSDTRTGAFASQSLAGNLGTGILSRFRIAFDYQGHTLTFWPNSTASASFRTDRTGLSVTQKGPQELTVLSVRSGSPAEFGGVRAGDRIVAVNQASVAGNQLGVYDLEALRYGIKPFELTVLRNGQATTLTITPKTED